MKVQKFETREEWLEARRGRITGTRLKDLVIKRGTTPKIGFYEIIAERVAIPASDENVMDRGLRLEDAALSLFEEAIGRKVKSDLVIWSRDDSDDIAVSPDGSIGKTEAIECKCLSSARHLEAWVTNEIPSDYEYQVLQYFIVNESLKVLHFVFYDPRMPKELFWIDVKREDVKAKIEEYLALEKDVLARIAEIEIRITF